MQSNRKNVVLFIRTLNLYYNKVVFSDDKYVYCLSVKFASLLVSKLHQTTRDDEHSHYGNVSGR